MPEKKPKTFEDVPHRERERERDRERERERERERLLAVFVGHL